LSAKQFDLALETARAIAVKGFDSDWQLALSIEASVRERDYERSTRVRLESDIAVAQAVAGQVDDALETARAITSAFERVDTLFVIGLVCRRDGRTELGGTLVAEAISHVGTASVPDLLQSRFVDYLSRIGDFAFAMRIARQIDNEWSRVQALKAIAAAQAQTGKARAARTTLAIALEPGKEEGREPERVAVLIDLALAQFAAAQADDARATLEMALELADRCPSASDRTWKRVEVGLAMQDAGDLDRALETVRAVEDQSARGHALGEIGAHLARDRHYEQAFEILPEMSVDYQKRNLIEAISRAQVQARDFDGAIETAQMLEDDWSRTWRLRDVAEAQAQAGDVERARQTFAAAVACAKTAQVPDSKRVMLLEVVGEAQARSGDLECARVAFDADLAIAQTLYSPEEQAEAIRSIAAAQAQAGDRARASTTFDLAIEAAQGSDDDDQATDLWRQIAQAQAETGDAAAALETVQKLKSQLSFGSGLEADYALRGISETMARNGDLALALETAQKISTGLERDRAMCAVARRQAEAGLFTAALETAHAIQFEGERAGALESIAQSQLNAGQLPAALETAQSNPNAYNRARSLTKVAERQAESGDPAALETVAEISGVETIRPLGGDTYHLRTEGMSAVARAFATAGFGALAIRAAEAIVTERARALTGIAAALATAGDRDHFKELIIPCAYDAAAAYRICGLLGHLYPDSTPTLAAIVRGGGAGIEG
jgi:tetratricopeptide (TPR) repeat protein